MFTKLEIESIAESQIASLLWSAGEQFDESGEFTGLMWDDAYCAEDASAELVVKLTEELEQLEDVEFYGIIRHEQLAEAIKVYQNRYDFRWASQFGHDLALTRNHHGAGFWDRGLGEAGVVLTDWAQGLGELSVFAVSDDCWSAE